MPDPALYRLADEVGAALTSRGLMLVTAESCTGGWVSTAITMVPGSSEWFERGFVTYTHISKREMLDSLDWRRSSKSYPSASTAFTTYHAPSSILRTDCLASTCHSNLGSI